MRSLACRGLFTLAPERVPRTAALSGSRGGSQCGVRYVKRSHDTRGPTSPPSRHTINAAVQHLFSQSARTRPRAPRTQTRAWSQTEAMKGVYYAYESAPLSSVYVSVRTGHPDLLPCLRLSGACAAQFCAQLFSRLPWSLTTPAPWSHSPSCGECDHGGCGLTRWTVRPENCPQKRRDRRVRK